MSRASSPTGTVRSNRRSAWRRVARAGVPCRSCAATYNPAVSHQEHRSQGPDVVGCFVLTVSDTRTPATDKSGQAIRALLEEAGHVVTGHAIVRDEPADVATAVRNGLETPETRVIITTGGTGITARD